MASPTKIRENLMAGLADHASHGAREPTLPTSSPTVQLPSMHGFLNLNKPAGMTSRQVVDRIQRLNGTNRVGHAGTLDPLATGVLVVGVGAATRLIEYVQRMPKSYRGTFLLGRQSPTEDLEGDVTLLQTRRRRRPSR